MQTIAICFFVSILTVAGALLTLPNNDDNNLYEVGATIETSSAPLTNLTKLNSGSAIELPVINEIGGCKIIANFSYNEIDGEGQFVFKPNQFLCDNKSYKGAFSIKERAGSVAIPSTNNSNNTSLKFIVLHDIGFPRSMIR